LPFLRLASLLMARLDWIQVEVTSHCNAACLYCPHTVYREQWAGRHMSLATFRQLLPAFAKSSLVYLQGWGEPFLNPDIFDLIALAKQASCQVGTTTNGMLLDADKIIKLVESGLDLVAFSLAGTDEENDASRRGTSLQKVLEVMAGLKQAKEKLGRSKPAIHVAYLLLRSGLANLVKLPLILQGLGVSQVVVSLLNFVPRQDLEAENVRPETAEEYHELKARLDEVTQLAEPFGMRVHYHLKAPGERQLLCPENVQRALFVGADGSIAPCVFTNLPLAAPVTYVFQGQELPYRRLTFGNLQDLSLPAIWRQRPYANFRRAFFTGRPPAPCQACARL
jgi:MoaA/NifB/PqqE/SkfB family radical SAM enzyme